MYDGQPPRRRKIQAARFGLAALCALPLQLLGPSIAAHAAVTFNGTTTLDESPGLQNGPDADGNDDDVAPIQSVLPADFFDRLELLQLLPDAFTTDVGASRSVENLIVIDSLGAPLSSLELTDAAGDPLDGSQASGVATLDGVGINLVSDEIFPIAYGIRDDDPNVVVFAVYLDTTPDDPIGATLVHARLWAVTFEPLEHLDTTNADDRVDLLQNVRLSVTSPLVFDFNNLPSGQNLFGMVGDSATEPAIVVFGKTPVLKANGTYTNTSDTINTSKGGGPTTIGVNNQMFDPGEGAYFTYVNNPNPSFLAGAPNGLDQNEADDADNIVYGVNTTDDLLDVGGASFKISQTQGKEKATAKITAFSLSEGFQGASLITNRGTNKVSISKVQIEDANGVVVAVQEGIGTSPANNSGAQVTIALDGTAQVVSAASGLGAAYVVRWETTGTHNHALVEAVAGKFDIGQFGVEEGDEDRQSLAGRMFVDDDGPALGPLVGRVQPPVPFAPGSVFESLKGVFSTDRPALDGQYAITNWDPDPLEFGEVTLLGDLVDDTTLIFFQDVAHPDGTEGAYDEGIDVLFYQLTLSALAGSGQYGFEVVNAPEPPSLTFDFNDLPSGQNLFGMVGNVTDALVVIGRDVLLKGNNIYAPGSDTINTSKGGGPTTIGVNNQMFDTGEGAYFTYVKNPNTSFLAGAPGGLDQNEADDADNILYGDNDPSTEDLLNVSGAFLQISQIQGGAAATIGLTAYLLDDDPPAPALDPKGKAFVDALGTGVEVDITVVRVKDLQGDILEEVEIGDPDPDPTNDISIDFDPVDNTIDVTVAGLGAGFKIEWETITDHNQVLVEAVAGKFDIGAFGLSEPQVTPDHQIDFEVGLTDEDGDAVTSEFSICIDGDLDAICEA